MFSGQIRIPKTLIWVINLLGIFILIFTLFRLITFFSFRPSGIDFSNAGLYIWCTRGEDSWDSVSWLAEIGILATPGIFYGQAGAKHIRIAMTATDAQIADAVLELFRKRDTIDVFNKKALYIYIREIVDVKTPKITKVADKLHDIFKSKYYFYLENGHCKF